MTGQGIRVSPTRAGKRGLRMVGLRINLSIPHARREARWTRLPTSVEQPQGSEGHWFHTGTSGVIIRPHARGSEA
jgi:hypothetical protein